MKSARLISLCLMLNRCEESLARIESVRPQTDSTVIMAANLFRQKQTIIQELLDAAQDS